ncbi:alpha-amylase family glycosyl hydrolase [Kitasatospora sp. NBC_01250]|uniref:alpha-amylase family glycosyl hydrolase n=1 Tax=unclassified Kitasatospora TaxID=2633591 RepID=UPI002E0E87A5|nr:MULTISPECIES: alpha-amylase family glycosyl hydrolase [unclassified Kitasatospora]WSJ70393.1 alpha-amylase family glycosyl hydrolase [Kitasatospora sp. NBC_01302]
MDPLSARQPAVPSWLADAVLYQIYPQSFADSNGDGIGDLPGVTARLDHLAALGVTALWLSPCFSSEFGDAGYDVADYLTIAPRYGSNQDLAELVRAAGERGIRVLLDLVPGHTSHRHPWFRQAAHDPADDRYIWSERIAAPVHEWIPNQGRRGGFYRANFYPIQPALNFGYARPDPAEPWRSPVDAPGPRANRAALREIMAHWFALGVAGFRVDMAASLVKDDPGHLETAKLWGEMRGWLDREHPDRVLIAEWGDPARSVPAGLHADFFLHFNGRGLRSLWDNGTGSQGSWAHGEPCYFDPEGGGSMAEFLTAWRDAEAAIDGRGLVALPTANHDFSRLSCGPRTREQLACAFAFLLTWPGLPVIYYGDEIGMRYVPGLPDKEGSQFGTEARQGSRTPMQWDDSPGAGFSGAPPADFYLPLDPDPQRPSVAAQRPDPDSPLSHVRRLIRLRRDTPELGTDCTVTALSDGYPFAYLRGERHLVVVNPRRAPAALALPQLAGRTAEPLLVHGVTAEGDRVRAEGFAYGVFRL